MNDSRIDRPYLESLTSEELSRLADNYGVDIPPELERVFIIEELLDLFVVDEDGDGEEQEDAVPLRETGFLEPAALPKQYNITFIDIIIRDPLWAFTLWEVKSHDRDLYEKAPGFDGYLLKVSPLEGERGGVDSFTVQVGDGDGAWYLGFPPTGGRYTVALCVKQGEEEIGLAVSRPFKMPKLFSFPPAREEDGGNAGENSRIFLSRLSGAGDLPVLRQVDRLSRSLKPPSSPAGIHG